MLAICIEKSGWFLEILNDLFLKNYIFFCSAKFLYIEIIKTEQFLSYNDLNSSF